MTETKPERCPNLECPGAQARAEEYAEFKQTARQAGRASAWLNVFFRQWLWEMIRCPGDWREHFQGTCFACMHYLSQHIRYEDGTIKCAAERCNCRKQRAGENGKVPK